MMNEPIYYLNGKYVPKSKALISVHDMGWTRGYGIFDFIVTHQGGKAFMLDEHIERLLNSAKLINLRVPWSKNKLMFLVKQTLNKNNNDREKTIRIVISGGISETSMSVTNKPTIAIMINDWHSYPKSYYTNGIRVITFDSVRINPQAKSLNYTQGIKALSLARKSGAIEAIYINTKTDRVYEAVTSNIFLVKSGNIITPNKDTLVGVTRELVRKIVGTIYPIKVREVKIRELFDADEVFLSASNKEIMPIVKIDSKKIGKGVPGEITKKVMLEYRNFVNSGKW